MSLEYNKVLDDRTSSLLKIEGLIITILVATVSIILNFAQPVILSSIINSLIAFLIFFIISLATYSGLSSYTFKKREEISEKFADLRNVTQWREKLVSMDPFDNLSIFFRILIDILKN